MMILKSIITRRGWRHPKHGEFGGTVYRTEWNVDNPHTWTKATGDCFASFVRFAQVEGSNAPYARINGRALSITKEKIAPFYMEHFYSARPINTFGFALFKDGVRVSNILPVKITIYGDMMTHNGMKDELRIYAYPA